MLEDSFWQIDYADGCDPKVSDYISGRGTNALEHSIQGGSKMLADSFWRIGHTSECDPPGLELGLIDFFVTPEKNSEIHPSCFI